MVLVNACGRLIKEPQNNSVPLPFHFHQLFRSQLLLFLYVNIWNIAELLRNLNLVDQILTCDKNMIACLCLYTHCQVELQALLGCLSSHSVRMITTNSLQQPTFEILASSSPALGDSNKGMLQDATVHQALRHCLSPYTGLFQVRAVV